jgi:TetR/AcrR family transcriptional repressor of nem operon
MPPTDKSSAKTKLLDAALSVIRSQGYAATTVDELCAAAGVTKGAFFHHFKSKEHLGVAAADYWSETTGGFFDEAPYNQLPDPLDRVLAYIDFRKALLDGPLPEITCLVGTMVQETYDSSPAIRDACERCMSAHCAKLETDIAEAIETYGIEAPWTADSLALYTQAVVQGALILAKARNDTRVASDSFDHLRRYVELLFNRPHQKEPVQ